MDAFHIDHNRKDRLGFPEIIYGASKDEEVLAGILQDYVQQGQAAMITRLQADKARALTSMFPAAFYDERARVFLLNGLQQAQRSGDIAILSAGTSDQAVVEEAYYTLHFLGVEARRVMDIGVSGIHRLMGKVDMLKSFSILIVVAGFEGALPSVVGGLFPQPIIAVPTSVGYGVSAQGQAALNSMLASCANGITVVNIDNGYGAAMAAYRILKAMDKGRKQ
ncbi:MAG: nickel pincer cofactor biosynthesis protein LarB [Bacteroidetes bacterium]|nr:MAG: nickel pincer cofactor biosynthesis protein LarB [Bacteroidota bacterium]